MVALWLPVGGPQVQWRLRQLPLFLRHSCYNILNITILNIALLKIEGPAGVRARKPRR